MASASVWLSAFRLRTLPLALSGILLGSMLAYADGFFDGYILASSILTATFLQILSNLANDLGDTENGADNNTRVGPQRAVQSGAISKSQMKSAVVIMAALAFVSGLTMLYFAFWPDQINAIILFLVIGIASIIAAVKYTMGDNPYGYKALGDPFVFLFFGWVAVVGIYYLTSKNLSWSIFLPATSIGLLSVAVLNLNNMRDALEDLKVGKITIPVKLGVKKSHQYHLLLFVLTFACALIFAIGYTQSLYGFLFLLLIPIIYKHIRKVSSVMPAALNPELKKIALLTLAFSILLGVGCIFG